MTVPQKVCPRCQTSAPLEAAFCRQCGRQYKTQFTSDNIPAPLNVPLAPPPAEFAAGPPLVLSRRLTQTLTVLGALVVFLSVLAARSTMRHDVAAKPDTSGLPQPPPYAAPQVPATTSSDPINDEAKRFIEQEKQEHGLDPPPSSVGPDGRIHLQNGGSITREEWDKAKRAVQQSQLNPPMPAPPIP